jgi:hypothetical protein
MQPEITDDTRIACINSLATVLAETYGLVKTVDDLTRLLADIVGKPMKTIDLLSPQGKPIPDRKLPNILCGSSKCTILLVRENGCAAKIKFPSTVGKIDTTLANLGNAQTEDEVRLGEFEEALMGTLDGYGHMNWTVGNEDWVACADASLGRFRGRLFLAWHVVVDCESGGWIDTIEKGTVEITPEITPPAGILSQYLDNCMEFYIDKQNDDPDNEGLQIDVDRCLKAIQEFDEHVRHLWQGEESSIDLDWDEDEDEDEDEEPFDPRAMGWVGHDGRP